MNITMEPETEKPRRRQPTLASCRLTTPASVKANGWERFMTWVQEGGIALLAKRISEAGPGYDHVARQPILAAAVPTDWVNKVTKKGTAPRSDDTLTMPSSETRADFRGLSSRIYENAADGYELHVEVRSYRHSGTRGADHPEAAITAGFTIVSLGWLAQALDVSERDFYAVEQRLPWFSPHKPRTARAAPPGN